jgi:hypothetical protein
MTPIVDHALLRARIAAAAAARLAGQTFVDIDSMDVPIPNLWTYLRDLRTCVDATRRLVDACSAGEVRDPALVDLVLAALQQANQRGWLHACACDLPDFDVLLDAIESEIAQRLAQRRATRFPARTCDAGGDLSVADHALQMARMLTNGHPGSATHLLTGAALLALREAI